MRARVGVGDVHGALDLAGLSRMVIAGVWGVKSWSWGAARRGWERRVWCPEGGGWGDGCEEEEADLGGWWWRVVWAG